MTGFDQGTLCATCGAVNGSCPATHDVGPTLLYDSIGERRRRYEWLLRAREIEARKLGEAA